MINSAIEKVSELAGNLPHNVLEVREVTDSKSLRKLGNYSKGAGAHCAANLDSVSNQKRSEKRLHLEIYLFPKGMFSEKYRSDSICFLIHFSYNINENIGTNI